MAEPPTLIGNGCVINGDISDAPSVRVEGTLFGNVLNGGNLIIAEEGSVTGNATVESATVFGHLKGNVIADVIKIMASATIFGKLNARSLTVEKGASYAGEIEIGKHYTPENN